MAADELVPCMDDWCKISPCKCRDAINALIAERDKLQARLAEWRAWACKMEAERDKLRGILCGEFVLWCETHDKPMEECQPDTPQSVPACTCTCTCNPLWDGYDGDCPIHGWFEPHTPDTPQSVPAPEQSFRFIDSGGAALAMKLRERDKLKEALVCVINLSNNAPDGSALDECNKDARAALRTSEGK
jgi:hypothetical protein